MTYLTFHAVFVLPPLLLLVLLNRGAVQRLGRRALWTVPAVALIAVLYTTPWDNYLVYRGVWWYGTDRVIGTIGYVPVEEYLFFMLQPLLTGAWTYLLLQRPPVLSTLRAGEPLRSSAPSDAVSAVGDMRDLGVAVYALCLAGGALALTYEPGLYLGLILVWAAPVLAAQWFFVGRAMARAPAAFAAAVMAPTVYLWVADRIAIGAGIWSIAPQYTTGLHLLGLPMEEALFFLVTNLLVVQGVLLFLLPSLRAAAPAAGSAPVKQPLPRRSRAGVLHAPSQRG
jgi:lycopene beta-cyclase